MKFFPTKINGSWLIELDKKIDSRGYFAREYCYREFNNQDLESTFVQSNICSNNHKGIIRGLHCQKHPYSEVKVVRCLNGAIFDVLVDMRPESPTFMEHYATELTSDNSLALYIPKGCFHGYQTLTNNAVILYHVSQYYMPESETGLRYNDPKLNIIWPLNPSSISPKDLAWKLL